MAEKLGIYGTFGNGSAVHGYVACVFSRTIGMDDLRKKLLARAALAAYKHRQIDRRHTYGALDSGDKSRSVAYDAETQFSLTYIVGKIFMSDIVAHYPVVYKRTRKNTKSTVNGQNLKLFSQSA